MLNWAYDTNTATSNRQTWNVDEWYDPAEGPLVGQPMYDYTGTGAASTNPNGAQTWKGFPPAADPSDDVLIVIFADESLWSYHLNSENVFTLSVILIHILLEAINTEILILYNLKINGKQIIQNIRQQLLDIQVILKPSYILLDLLIYQLVEDIEHFLFTL